MALQDSGNVDRGEFEEFCSLRRLVGTGGNREAADMLVRALESEGFIAHVDSSPQSHVDFLWGGAVMLAISVYAYVQRGNPGVATALMLLGGMSFRAWREIRAGAPVAVFGEQRKDLLVTGPHPSKPTIILGAHYDTASLPFTGSYIRTSALMLLVLIGIELVAAVTHPIAGIAAAALCGFYLFSGNRSPGADDNASGVFAVLSCVRRLKDMEGINLVPVFFNFEEEGVFGSRYWFKKRLDRKGLGLPGLGPIDPKKAWMLNFDCVGRGRRVFISGSKKLRDELLNTPSARRYGATATSFYPSDHLSFRKPWQAVAFARANRHWMLDLGWIHSQRDVPHDVNLSYICEVSSIVEDFARAHEGQSGNPTPTCHTT